MIGLSAGKMSRADAIVRRFGVAKEMARENTRWRESAEGAARELLASCRPGAIVLVRGASGSGKSVLLQALARELGSRAVVCEAIEREGTLVIDCLPWLELEDVLQVLARFGLGEVYTYLSPAMHLSTGQRGRLNLAVAYARAIGGRERVLIADEFGTQLDRFSAAVIARNLRRVMDDGARLCAVVATCHDDLEKALRPDIVVDCDFGEYRTGKRGSDAVAIGR